MLARLHKALLVLTLLVLPLQGAAAAMHALACAPHGKQSAAAGHAHSGGHAQSGDHTHSGERAHGHDHDHVAPHEHSGNDGAEHAGHLCCHHAPSAAAPALLELSAAALPVYLSSLTSLETLFFPEQPQRPPRG